MLDACDRDHIRFGVARAGDHADRSLRRSGIAARIGEAHFYSTVDDAVTDLAAGPPRGRGSHPRRAEVWRGSGGSAPPAAPRRRAAVVPRCRPHPFPSAISARTGRWSDPANGSTAPATGRSAPRTKMWSIWLWGRQAGQVRPTTALRQPGK